MQEGYRVTLFVGTGSDKYGLPIKPSQRAAALARLRIKLAELFGGYTESDHNGGWINPESQLVQETSTSFQVITNDLHLIGKAANWAQTLLLQEQVLVTREPIHYEFVDLAAAERDKKAAELAASLEG